MIKVNMTKAKAIADDVRRQKRSEKFAPLDVKATIPAEAETAEMERQVIRDEDNKIQAKIAKAKTEGDLKAILVDNALV